MNPQTLVTIFGSTISATVALIFILILVKKNKKTKTATPLFAPKENFASKVKNLFVSNHKTIQEIIPEIEEILLTADTGLEATENLIEDVFEKNSPKSKEEAFELLKEKIKTTLTPKTSFEIDKNNKPYVIYLVGVNGVGKTTTIGKLACQFKAEGHDVTLVAADTFRAAAIDQLKVWADRNEVGFIGGKPMSDPSSVIVDGLRSAKAKGSDVVLVDTAGRLHTKHNLMEELKKMVRMSEKELGKGPDEVFLVIDSITGQNGFQQAKVFLEATPVSGIVLTKYDATSKGGIIISIVQNTGLPIRYVGLGEGIEDLKKFQADDFIKKLFAA